MKGLGKPTHLAGEAVAHGLEDGHELAREAGPGVQILGSCAEAEGLQLAAQSQGAKGVLGNVGAVHAVDAVGAEHALLSAAPLHVPNCLSMLEGA